MLKTLASAAAALVLSAGAVHAASQDARGFVVWIYSHYPQPESSTFDPMGRSAARVFDAGMVALLKEDSRLANGEVGAVDADEFCMCQDDGGMTVSIGAVRSTGPASADADVTLSYPHDAQAGAPTHLTLRLVKVGAAWRVHDIASHDQPSFKDYLVKANAEARRAAHHH